MTTTSRTSRAGGRRAAGGLLALALWTVAALAQGQQSPDNLVKEVADDVLRALREDPDLRAGNQTKMAQLIEQKIAPHFEFERMTRLAVGKAWRQATDGQKKALMEQFRQLLVRSYSAAWTAYQDIVVDVKPLRMQPGDDDVVVRTVIKRPGDAPPVEANYSLYKTDSKWKVYDVSVEGVSLLTTYRSTFAEEIRRGGIDGLIKSLREKNAQTAQTKKQP
jgi:phospholipid transport system substrate-binding protein